MTDKNNSAKYYMNGELQNLIIISLLKIKKHIYDRTLYLAPLTTTEKNDL